MPEYIRRPYKVHAEKTKKPKVIHTLEGDMKASPGDMIVTGRRGEKWPVKPGIFEESYRVAKAEVLRLKELKENPLNRNIDRNKVSEIKRAIIRTGVIKPLVYTEIMTDDGKENMLTDGHHRYVALREMGYRRVPAVMADERGIETANTAKPEQVKKAKRKCPEGHYRDKDGKCRRRHRYGYGGGVLVIRPKPPKENGNGETPPPTNGSGVTKHTPGGVQHDQSTHTPKTRRAREAVSGATEAGAVHLATIAIPAVVVGTLMRIAPRIGLGVVGVTAAFLLYEIPQLAFRIAEGGVRGYEGERPYRATPTKMMKVGNRDVGGQVISRGDHALVIYQGNANVGVHLGGDVTRLLDGKKLVDVKTNQTNRMKISTGEDVPSARPEDTKKTRRVLNELIREQATLLNIAQNLQQRSKSVQKHGTHNQKDHAPKGTGKAPDKAKELRAQLKPAIREHGSKNILEGKRGEIHADVMTDAEEKSGYVYSGKDELGFIDDKGNFITREEAKNRVGIYTSEELLDDKVTKHQQGKHNQASHDPTGGRGGAKTDISEESPDTSIPAKLNTFQGIKNHLGQGTKVIVSAEKSNLSVDENRRRSLGLKRFLQNLSDDVTLSDSKYEGSQERGYVATISPDDVDMIQELALDPNEGNQDSIIIINNGKAEMRFRDGKKLHGDVDDMTERVEADDNYSSIGGVKFTIPFREKTEKRIDTLRNLIVQIEKLLKLGVTSIPVQGLGLVREDLGARIARGKNKKRRSEKGWMTGRTIQLSEKTQKLNMDREGSNTKRPAKNPDGPQIEGSRV